MARTIFVLVMGLHGLIHLMGFVKAFHFAEIKELTQTISKPLGLLWFVTFFIFMAASVQYFRNHEFWWLTAIIGLLSSQALVFIFWSDAKFGTLPNIFILVVAVVGFAHFSFTRQVSQEIEQMFSQQTSKDHEVISKERISELPAVVQKWLLHANIPANISGNEDTHTVRLKQKALIKLKPEQSRWIEASAEQYFTLDKPAFIWKVDMQMMPFLGVVGRDRFLSGQGEMLIKILSLVPVVNSRGNEKINSGTLQRYLGEIVWFPSAALHPYITWEAIDDLSAKATMTYRGTTGSGVFYFSPEGDFIEYRAQRFMGSGADAALKEWVITVTESDVVKGVTIPTKMEATWKLESGDWTWLKLEITDIEKNLGKEY